MAEPIDTSPLLDMRNMIGPVPSRDLDEVEAARARWVEQHGYAWRRRRGDWSTDEHQSSEHVVAYVSGGKWIADCPHCRDGIAAWPFVERGVCLGCGTAYVVDYPSEAEIRHAVAALRLRPSLDQFWHAHHGETADDLHRENKMLQLRASLPGMAEAKQITVGSIVDVLGREAVDKLIEAGAVRL